MVESNEESRSEVDDSEIDELLNKIKNLILEDDFGNDLPAVASLLDDESAQS